MAQQQQQHLGGETEDAGSREHEQQMKRASTVAVVQAQHGRKHSSRSSRRDQDRLDHDAVEDEDEDEDEEYAFEARHAYPNAESTSGSVMHLELEEFGQHRVRHRHTTSTRTADHDHESASALAHPGMRWHSNESTTLCESDQDGDHELLDRGSASEESEREHERGEEGEGRQRTPPMTPDDTLSSMSTSPGSGGAHHHPHHNHHHHRRQNHYRHYHDRGRSTSPSTHIDRERERAQTESILPPATPAKAVIFVEDEDAASRVVPDTPATGRTTGTVITSEDFSILRTPAIQSVSSGCGSGGMSVPSTQQYPQQQRQHHHPDLSIAVPVEPMDFQSSESRDRVPPSPVRHLSLAVHRTMNGLNAGGRQVESDTEVTVGERRRNRSGGRRGFEEMKERLKRPIGDDAR